MPLTVKIERIKSVMKHKEQVSVFLARYDCIKLHIGCGTVYKKGWINIDNNSDYNIAQLDLHFDLRFPLPFPENSVDFIFNEHFFEHLTAEEGKRMLESCLHVLKPGGVIRIAMPDLADIIQVYTSQSSDALKTYVAGSCLEFVQTKAELLNIAFRWWGHQWLYDWEELGRRLKEAGFKRWDKCLALKSTYPELCNLETRLESTLVAEAIK